MLRVSALEIKNIGPFKTEVIDFSIQQEHPDIHIFTGVNGSGKTTLLHAIASNFDHFEKGHKEHLSNLFYKRFHYFETDNKGYKSFAITILNELYSEAPQTIAMSYGCPKCRNLHQGFLHVKDKKFIDGLANEDLKDYRDPIISDYQNATASKDISKKTFKFAAFGYSGYRFISSTKIKINDTPNFNPLHLALEFVKKNNENANISNWIISRYSKAAIEETHGNKELAQKYRAALNCLIEGIGNLTNNEFTFEIQTNPWKVVIKYFDKEVEFDVLPDGLRSVLSWLGDLLMRLDEIPWENKNIPVNHQDIILMLDEIEVHLHPKWQYQILPLTKKIFPNAQIFLTTHSPFVLNSIDNAKIYKLKTEKGISSLDEVILSETGDSYSYVYENILETTHKFGPETSRDLNRFQELDQEIVKKNYQNEAEFKAIINRLKTEGEEVNAIISSKLFRLKDVTGKDYLNGKN